MHSATHQNTATDILCVFVYYYITRYLVNMLCMQAITAAQQGMPSVYSALCSTTRTHAKYGVAVLCCVGALAHAPNTCRCTIYVCKCS